MPAIVALVASNFAAGGTTARLRARRVGGRDRGRGRAAHRRPLHDVLVVAARVRRRSDRRPRRSSCSPAGWWTRRPGARAQLDLVGTALSATGMALIVFGVLQAGVWGFVQPKRGAPEWLGLSPVIWLAPRRRGRALWLFLAWEHTARSIAAARRSSTRRCCEIRRCAAASSRSSSSTSSRPGCSSRSRCSCRSRSACRRSTPGSACSRCRSRSCSPRSAIPKVFPHASPRRVVQLGFLALFVGIVVLVGALDAGAGPEIVTVPMLLAGLGIGALASQLGAVTVVGGTRRAERSGRRRPEHRARTSVRRSGPRSPARCSSPCSRRRSSRESRTTPTCPTTS